MTRYLCWLAVLGIVLIPDWASAARPVRGGFLVRPIFARPILARPIFPILERPIFPILERPILARPVFARQYYEPPVYHAPTYLDCQLAYGQPPVYAQPPVYPNPNRVLPPPRIETFPKSATPTPAPAPTPSGLGTGNPATPAKDTVRPAGGSDTTPPGTANPKKDQPTAGGGPSLPTFPEVDIPKSLGPLPKLEVPKDPDFRPIPVPKGSPAETPKKPAPVVPDPASALPDPNPKLPPIELPKNSKTPAVAVPAPAPAFPEPLIPSPSVPELPDAKKESLPSLTLPPDTPVKTDSTSRSSPLTGGRRDMTVSVFAASGTERPTGVYRTVGFYNHTDRDLNLTIEGRAVKLPARTYLHAQLAPTFTWGHGDRPAARETVPDGAGGLDVVFRSVD